MWHTTTDVCPHGRSGENAGVQETENRASGETELGGPDSDDVRVFERSRRRSASGEYRTYFHIGQSWGINESTAYRIIRKVENILSQSRAFSLPGKKQLSASEYAIEVVVVDVTESQIERPKKTETVL